MTAGKPSEGREANRYESIVETIADGVFVLDSDVTITFVNEAVEAFLGLDREALVGTTFGDLAEQGAFDAEGHERFVAVFEAVRDGENRERRRPPFALGWRRSGNPSVSVRLSTPCRANYGDSRRNSATLVVVDVTSANSPKDL